MSDDRVIKSYVWHGEKCFFVSTIERESSAAMAYGARYNETLVWEYDWERQKRWGLLYQEEDAKGSISRHLCVCMALYRDGTLEVDDW